MKKLSYLAIASTIVFSSLASALPSNERTRIYYSDSTHTVAVGEKLVTLCEVGIVNMMIWGTTSSHYVNEDIPCDTSSGSGPGGVPRDSTCESGVDCDFAGRDCDDDASQC